MCVCVCVWGGGGGGGGGGSNAVICSSIGKRLSIAHATASLTVCSGYTIILVRASRKYYTTIHIQS